MVRELGFGFLKMVMVTEKELYDHKASVEEVKGTGYAQGSLLGRDTMDRPHFPLAWEALICPPCEGNILLNLCIRGWSTA